LGQVVVAFVQPIRASEDGAALVSELAALCTENLARYKNPVEWHVIDEMPRNAAGKIVKPRLRERLAGEPA